MTLETSMRTVFRVLPMLVTIPVAGVAGDAVRFREEVLPLLKASCFECHSAEKHKGDLDLERFGSVEEMMKEPEVWQAVRDQVMDGAMPPEEGEPMMERERNVLLGWVREMLTEAAREHAGDPGPVVLRRLSNAEYTWTLRDLTGVRGLDPAREFPADGAAGEGFTNAGAALTMSPSLVTKYLEAAKEVAQHAALLPDGLEFSEATTARDRTEEKLAAIRAFYGRYCGSEGGTKVNLQGIQFETNGGGRLPLEKYLEAAIAVRGGAEVKVAAAGLSERYLEQLVGALRAEDGSPWMGPLRARWREAKPGEGAALAAMVGPWQQTMWQFTTVGHIGKRDGPRAWQVPVEPFAESQELRMKLPAAGADGMVTVRLVATDAGDGAAGDLVAWTVPRLVAAGRPDLALRDVRAAMAGYERARAAVGPTAAMSLAAVAGAGKDGGKEDLGALAAKHGVDAGLLASWLRLTGTGATAELMTGKVESQSGGVKLSGWGGADALSVIANPSGETVRIPGAMGPKSLAMHPAPQRAAIAAWRAAEAGRVGVAWTVRDAHPDCGNGVSWALELRRGAARLVLGTGVTEGGKLVEPEAVKSQEVRVGDLICLVIGPRDGEHTCDLTEITLRVTPEGGGAAWDVTEDCVGDLAVANPHAGRGGEAVWHFLSEPTTAAAERLPAGSVLTRWLLASDAEKPGLAMALQGLLTGPEVSGDGPDAVLRRTLLAPGGPLLGSVLTGPVGEVAAGEGVGPDPGRFGRGPGGETAERESLVVRAPSVVEVKIPAVLAAGAELVTVARLHAAAGGEGSVQVLLTGDGADVAGLSAGRPVLTAAGSAARERLAGQAAAFRELFPAALCYTKIVPVDEVVTLTLYYREDDQLRRLLLSEAESAEIDRLWRELHFVSQDALQSVDAYDQLWQFATQDADPSAFEPLREPIRAKAAVFREEMKAAEPRHVEWLVGFAPRAWRRAVSAEEGERIRGVYARLRADEVPHEEAVRLVLARILTSPAFLYRGEKAAEGKDSAPVSDAELAVRLSYFLWSSMPDGELSAMAMSGRLREPGVLGAQVERMLADGKVGRLAEYFGCQWLHIREVDTMDEKSERHFPTFAAVRGAMKEEAVRFFSAVFRGEAAVGDLIDADYTWLNGTLAGHYGIGGVEGEEWRRVDGVRRYQRGGLLGFAAVLAKQSGASRTSPILRGNWLCETLLGERLPKPPKGVPPLPEAAPEGLTERAMTEQHSKDARCSGCHVRMDPYGYALEGYDAIGRFRTVDAAGLAVTAKTVLPDGTAVEGMDGLRAWLAGPRREAFLRQFSRKLLGYALGRAVMLSDEPLIDEMTAALGSGGGKAATAVRMIVESRQFREVRGRAAAE